MKTGNPSPMTKDEAGFLSEYDQYIAFFRDHEAEIAEFENDPEEIVWRLANFAKAMTILGDRLVVRVVRNDQWT